MLEAIFKMLGGALLMHDIDAGLIKHVAASGRSRTLKGRFGRIESEELSARLFFVVSGEMRMMRMAPDGQECLMQRFTSGEFFCLSAVLSGHSCQSLMVSAKTTELMFWSHDLFRGFMRDNEKFYGNLLCQMAFQIEQEREMRTLSLCCKADVKVAAYLMHKIRSGKGCKRCAGAVVDLRPISLTAQELGIARETLSRSLQRLVKQNGITYQRGMVQVADISSLEAVLEDVECSCHCY